MTKDATIVEAPVLVADLELTGRFPSLPNRHPSADLPYAGVHLLVRLASEPLGILELGPPFDDEALAAAAWDAFDGAITQRLAAIGHLGPVRLSASGLDISTDDIARMPWVQQRRAILAEAPAISVVICTRGREEQLPASLDAIASLDYPDFELVLVDNAPKSEANRALIDGRRWDVPARYVVEPRPGLSWARNAGAHAATGSLVAFMDDDELPDVHWLAEYARAFAEVPDAGVASGLILPRTLDTAAERFFEGLGGHSKGRGFSRRVFDAPSHAAQHPLYPMPPFGAGGNMCFRRDVLDAIGYFDVALGTGTPSRGAEDTAAIADVMLAGHTAVWQPSAFVRHGHYPSFDGAANQLRGYGTALSAFYTRMLVEDPRRIGTLLRLLPTAIADVRRPGETLIGARSGPVLEGLRKAQLSGLASGPAAYLRSRSRQRKLAESS